MSSLVLRIPPRGLRRRIPALRRSSMNSPYCCLMETGTQTNEQPLPGSAPRLLINPVAETLMALIFQSLLARRLTALPQREERASVGAAALGRRGASARVTPGLLSSLFGESFFPPQSPSVWERTERRGRDESLCRRIKRILWRDVSANCI